jgi:MinD-like ATPase involved in chromosome partitioning or flagellar assembly
MPFLHFDEAKPSAERAVRSWLAAQREVERALLVGDLFGKLRLAVWSAGAPDTEGVARALRDACGPWWGGEVLHVDGADEVTRGLYAETARQARPDPDDSRLVVLDRHRSRTAWFMNEENPLWVAPDPYPPIVVFYSFKGGLGRSTILASFAIQRARAGERVCVLDLDLDSPGVGRLLAADASGLTAQWGVVDFLLEQLVVDAPTSDYYHRCDRVAGAGEIVVLPAGRVNEEYADKLARVDMEEGPPAGESGLARLLVRVRDELLPQWILLDARTGISESAGRLLSGIAHLHVLLGTPQDQSWEGLSRVLDRLGKERLLAGRPQAEVIMVQAMVPPGEAGRLAREAFLSRSEREFSDRYYAEAGPGDEAGGDVWDTRDIDSLDAPHVPVPFEYDARLATFRDIAEVADLLCAGSFATIAERITGRFAREVEA